jgi:hypothetical protein
MKALLILIFFITSGITKTSSNPFETKLVPIESSFGHKDLGLVVEDPLDPQMNLTLTIVTGSLENTRLVAKYYSSLGYFSIFDQTDMHLKMKGNVERLSQVLKTEFVKVKCQTNTGLECYASTSEVSIPIFLRSAILGIIGLEQVWSLKTDNIAEPFKESLKISSFKGLIQEAAEFYKFPNSSGLGTKVAIISLGGYFLQSDLQSIFNRLNLSTAPTIRTVFVDGAQQNFTDPESFSIINYLNVFIIAALVPRANITLYFSPNTAQGFYDVISTALQQSHVVSCPWFQSESLSSSYWTTSEQLLAKYRNIPVFMSAGNQGSAGGVGFPASCPSAISKLFCLVDC